MLRTEAIANFLKAETRFDLAQLYNFNMEVQVNVAQDNGERIQGEYKGKTWTGYTDHITTWKSFRIPHNAKTEPTYEDRPIKFDLAVHAEGIGMTGWDWVNKVSKWVAFDFDSILGHNAGLSVDELDKVQEVACGLPYVTVRKSTSGNGLHLYIFLNDVPTANHDEHAALARCILGILSAKTAYDFNNKVDVCGGNMWVWHRKMKGTEGLKLIKQGGVLEDIPTNWRDHVPVISGKAKRVIPTGVEKTDKYAELVGQYTREPLDDEHKKLIEYLSDKGHYWSWDQDNNLLVAHTYGLKEAHKDLNLRGVFNTVATGKDKPDHNCFCYPIKGGAWSVRRFTPGIAEAETWDQDNSGWTRCYLNLTPDLKIAARSNKGVEDPKGGYVFRLAEDAGKAVSSMGVQVNIPEFMAHRRAKLNINKNKKVVLEVIRETHDPGDKLDSEWIEEKGLWKRVINANDNNTYRESKNYDEVIRHLVSEQDKDAGWVVKSDGKWIEEPYHHVKLSLKSLNVPSNEIDTVLGDCIFKKWTLVNKPFQPEYLGDRKWNRDACQLKYVPSKADSLHYPTWRKVLDHVGKSLDESVKSNPWCIENGINSGYDYLKLWLASLFQHPDKPLPYLFLYGPEASGKSIFHESLRELLTPSGYKRADTALLSQQAFNGELQNAIICVVEETDLAAKNKTAYNRIKDWVTSPALNIHIKGLTPYIVQNTTHWIQCANDKNYCPIFPGDTRITMIYVDKPEKVEDKLDLLHKMKKEAPDFLGELFRLELPKSHDRLNVPVINTPDKIAVQDDQKNALEKFIDEKCHYFPGQLLTVEEFHGAFSLWLAANEPNEVGNWSKIKITKHMPIKFIKGRQSDAKHCYGNISFERPSELQLMKKPLRLEGMFLK